MLISVVMAVYNGEPFLEEAIVSILNQTYQEIELVIINDASIDGTKEILEKIIDDRVKIVHLEENKGAAAALNLGIEKARGEWIAIHDADDLSYPERIEKQVKYLKKNPNLVAVGSFIECIPDRDNSYNSDSLTGLENFINREQTSTEIENELYSACPLTHGTIIFSKRAFLEVGKYDPHLRICYDYEFWTRLILRGEILKVPQKLYKYRVYSDSLTNKNLALTIKESFFSCAKYISKSFNQSKSSRPSMVIFGSEEEARNFALQAKNVLDIVKIIYKKRKNYLRKIITMVKEEKLDGVIFLSTYKYKKWAQKYLLVNGMEKNKSLFEFWVWWKYQGDRED